MLISITVASSELWAQEPETREFGIRNTIKKLNRQLEKAADSFGNITDI